MIYTTKNTEWSRVIHRDKRHAPRRTQVRQHCIHSYHLLSPVGNNASGLGDELEGGNDEREGKGKK